MNNAKSTYVRFLKSHRLSITTPRLEVFDALYTYGLQTVNQLLSRCPLSDRASIYRSITLLERLGAVNRIPQGFKYKLELSEVFLPHHHHIICVRCGRHSDVEQKRLEDVLISIADSEGYTLASHKVELQGLCPKCQTTA